MTLAASRPYVLGMTGVIGVLAAVMAVALIAAVLGNPERVVVAAGDSDLSGILYLIVDRLAAAAGALLRLL
jgi:hypothetical protein